MTATLFNIGADGRTFWTEPELPFTEELAAGPVRIILVGCTSAKRSSPAPAGDLYDASPLYRKRREYAEGTGRPWAILSARHGVVTVDTELEPYDYSIADLKRGAHAGGLRNYGVRAIQAAYRLAGIGTSVKPGEQFATYDRELVLEVHAGRPYVELLELAAASFTGVTIEHPVAAMQIGEQLRHYNTVNA